MPPAKAALCPELRRGSRMASQTWQFWWGKCRTMMNMMIKHQAGWFLGVLCIYIQLHTHTHTHNYIYIYNYIYIITHIYIITYIYIYVYTHTNTHTHIYTHAIHNLQTKPPVWRSPWRGTVVGLHRTTPSPRMKSKVHFLQCEERSWTRVTFGAAMCGYSNLQEDHQLS